MRTEDLLEKYFDGATTCAEERELRRRFAEGEVPEELLVYRPMFAYWEAEKEPVSSAYREDESHEAIATTEEKKGVYSLRKWGYALGGIAAGLLLLLGIAGLFPINATLPENYVIINGKQYTDRQLIESKALEALNNVRFSDEDVSGLLFMQ